MTVDNNLVLRKAHTCDFFQIAELDRCSWNDGWASQYVPDGEHVWRLWVEYALVFCCFEGKKLVGVSLAFPTINNTFAVHKIFVHNDFRDKGIGTLLFNQLIEEMDKYDKDSFLTVSPENNAAIKLYKNLGYETEELINGYYREDEHRIIMKRHFLK